MLSKLAFRNVKRSFKDYLIYIITITLAFALMFSFNLISNSKDILELSELMSNFKLVTIFVSIIVAFVLSYLINYTVKFMFQKRSKEFATYLILGIEKKDITKMFLLENIILGIIALFFSFFVGYILSQFMSYIIMNIFDLPYQIGLSNDLLVPIILSLLYFGLIYLIVLFLSYRRIKKIKTYDLLYLEKKNENIVLKRKRNRILLFILSLICGIVGLIVFDRQFEVIGKEPSFSKILISIGLLIVSIYGITFTLSDFILGFVLKNKKIKYHKDNLFIVRQFSSKIKTMSFTLGTLSLLVTLTFASLNVSNMFNGIFEEQVNLITPYDISISDDEESFDKYRDLIKKDYTIEEDFVFRSYRNEKQSIVKHLSEESRGWNDVESIISLSDYNKLLKMRDLDSITLKDDEYYLHTTKELEEDIDKNKSEIKEITLSNDIILKQKAVVSNNYSTVYSYGSGYIIVVPDAAVSGLEIYRDTLIIDTKEDTEEKLYNQLVKITEPDMCEVDPDTKAEMCFSLGNVEVRGQVLAMNKSTMTILSFALFYLAFIFTTIVGTILAIQSLSDATKYKYRYRLLSKLGVEDHRLYKTIRKQLLLFFIFPLIYPIVISFLTITSLNKVFSDFLANDNQYLFFFLLGIGLFMFVYLIYYLATYFNFKRNINE